MMIYYSQSIPIQRKTESESEKLQTTTKDAQCANEGGNCGLPGGQICSIRYGSNGRWTTKVNQLGNVGCNNNVFGDPYRGRKKQCFYSNCRPFCTTENGTCQINRDEVCSVLYGIDNRWTQKNNLSGAVGCNNSFFGDPARGTYKVCTVSDCRKLGSNVVCANENGKCFIPQGQQCTVQYGTSGKSAEKPFIQASIDCNNGVFGDPYRGRGKECRLFNCEPAHSFCASENGNCKLPAGQRCSIRYGVNNAWTRKALLEGDVGCNNGVFGDPAVGNGKTCFFYGCETIPQKFEVTGAVYDATSNKPLLDSGNLVIQYTELFGARAAHTAKVTNGSWTISLENGNYKRVISKSGWATREKEIIVNGVSKSDESQKVYLSPAVDGWRVVLTWGALPKSLDAHLLLNNSTEISLLSKTVTLGSGKITLEEDNINGYGPESITLTKVGGVYKYYVHNYSKEVTLSDSQAVAVLYKGDQQVSEVLVPKGSGNNNIWYVYEINADDKTFVVHNTFSQSSN
jgi:hypothetical protein